MSNRPSASASSDSAPSSGWSVASCPAARASPASTGASSQYRVCWKA
ncbi:hypothetical protein NKH77_47535 [Streptomyces sp. M19]